MFRKLVLAGVAAASLSAVALGGATEASANPWGGYGGPPAHYHPGPPPWARAWGWRPHRHYWGHTGRPWGGPPAYARPAPYGAAPSVPPGRPHAYAPGSHRGYGPY